jgi:hypothetical protein
MDNFNNMGGMMGMGGMGGGGGGGGDRGGAKKAVHVKVRVSMSYLTAQNNLCLWFVYVFVSAGLNDLQKIISLRWAMWPYPARGDWSWHWHRHR